MKYFIPAVLFFLLLFGCETDTNDEIPEKIETPADSIALPIESFSLSGYYNSEFQVFQYSGGGASLSSPLYDDDSIRISFGSDFRTMILGKRISVNFRRFKQVPKAMLVEREELFNDSIQLNSFEFKNFEDFVDLFYVGDYGYSRDSGVYTYIVVEDSVTNFYHSYYQRDSSFSFSINSLRIDNEKERIFIEGELSSFNSCSDTNFNDIISLEDMVFSTYLEN